MNRSAIPSRSFRQRLEIIFSFLLPNALIRKQIYLTASRGEGKGQIERTSIIVLLMALGNLVGQYIQGNLNKDVVTDMFPYWERLQDANFAKGDFYTDAVSKLNPRMFFGQIVWQASRLLHVDYYSIVFSVKCVFAATFPMLWFFFIRGLAFDIAGGHNRNRDIFIAASIMGLALVGKFNYCFSVAWWPPIDTICPVAWNLSLWLGLLAFVSGFLSLLFLATLIHPVIGLCLILFKIVVSAKMGAKEWALLGWGWVLPALILSFAFRVPSHVTTAQFVKAYALDTHFCHYDVWHFGGTHVSWYVHFIFVITLILGAGLYGFKSKKGAVGDGILKPMFLSLTAYVGAVILQWVAVAVPIKFFVILGPSRYLMFGGWACLVFWAAALFPSNDEIEFKSNLWRPGLLILVCLALLASVAWRDDPKKELRARHPNFYKWVDTTPRDSVFIVPNDFGLEFSFVANRPLLCGNGAPFREDDMVEYANRMKKAATGNLQGYKVDYIIKSIPSAYSDDCGQAFRSNVATHTD